MPDEIGYFRIVDILGDRKRGIPAIIPISKASWWRGVASGRFPKSVKLGPRTTAWRIVDVRALAAEMGSAQ